MSKIWEWFCKEKKKKPTITCSLCGFKQEFFEPSPWLVDEFQLLVSCIFQEIRVGQYNRTRYMFCTEHTDEEIDNYFAQKGITKHITIMRNGFN
jgi:hypothetical protein